MAAFSAAVLYASFAAEPADAYLFPRLSSVLLALFCALNLVASFRRGSSSPISAGLCRKLAPGVAVMVVYVALAENAGFYPASAAAFFALAWIYGEGNYRRRLATVSAATALAMILIYLLFGVLLRVQTPVAFWVS